MGGFVTARAQRDGTVWPVAYNSALRRYELDLIDTRAVFLNSAGTGFAGTAATNVNTMVTNAGQNTGVVDPTGISEYRIHTGTLNAPAWDAVNGKGLNILNGTPSVGAEFIPFTAFTAAGFSQARTLTLKQASQISPGFFFRLKFRAESVTGSTGTIIQCGVRGMEAYSASGTYSNWAGLVLDGASKTGQFWLAGGAVAGTSPSFAMADNTAFEYRIEVSPTGQVYQTATVVGAAAPLATSTTNPITTPAANPTTLAAQFYHPFIYFSATGGTPALYLQEIEVGPRIPKKR